VSHSLFHSKADAQAPDPGRPSTATRSLISGQSPLERVLQYKLLRPVFQPIVNLRDASIHAHEALIRGPKDSTLHTPDALLKAATAEQLGFELETAFIVAQLRTWGQSGAAGRIFIDISADVLTRLTRRHAGPVAFRSKTATACRDFFPAPPYPWEPLRLRAANFYGLRTLPTWPH